MERLGETGVPFALLDFALEFVFQTIWKIVTVYFRNLLYCSNLSL